MVMSACFKLFIVLNLLCFVEAAAAPTFEPLYLSTTAQDLTMYASKAQQAYEVLKPDLSGLPLARTRIFKGRSGGEESAMGFVQELDDKLIVSIRGTSALADIIEDMDATLSIDRPLANGKRLAGEIHNGFLRVTDSCMDQVFAIVGELHVGKEIVVTGHSLGAAVAILLAAKLKLAFDTLLPNQIKVVCFSSPKTGDMICKRFINSTLGRNNILVIASYWDPICYLPRNLHRPGIVSYHFSGAADESSPSNQELIFNTLGLVSHGTVTKTAYAALARNPESLPDAVELRDFWTKLKKTSTKVSVRLRNSHRIPPSHSVIIDAYLAWKRQLWSRGVEAEFDEVMPSMVSTIGDFLTAAATLWAALG